MRDIKSLPGLRRLRTMFSTKKHSMPRIQSSTYLDLYMMGKEKERLLKESEKLGERNTDVRKRLQEIDLEMNKLPEAEVVAKANTNLSSSGDVLTQKDGVKKEWKKMSLNY